MILKGRIKFITDMIPECTILSDIGTDHAYIPIYMVMNKRCQRAIGSDIGKGPVAVANRNVQQHGVEDRVETRLGSGLKPISEDEMDACVIAGMGGMLIREILNDDLEKAKKAKALIIQPMNYIELVREWLYGNGFYIYDEGLIKEGFRIYNVIAARWTGEVLSKDAVYYYIGEKLIQKKDPLLKKYMANRIDIIDRIIKEMSAMKDKDSMLLRDYINIRNELYALLQRID
ncbi:tRNA (adenine(22)-N(1))-methyltransferase [Acetivibrio cellulolyticus]|uniref:tRNA (adenine(22)-N(1))-methyltransferase n=1 Tax=Acetivibrio cellulolyticus TaxID=35830 RepID=UPI0001E2E6CE|nr:class I SAM-dependent methyltransferase [Acetivibrio cellulolyticus]